MGLTLGWDHQNLELYEFWFVIDKKWLSLKKLFCFKLKWFQGPVDNKDVVMVQEQEDERLEALLLDHLTGLKIWAVLLNNISVHALQLCISNVGELPGSFVH